MDNSKQNQSDKNLNNTEKASMKTAGYLMYKPALCPIANCNHIVSASTLLSHFLAVHNTVRGLKGTEIYANSTYALTFDSTTLKRRQNKCLSLLAYGGSAEELTSGLTKSKITLYDAFLPKPYEKWKKYRIILMMLCRTTWAAMLKDKELEMKLAQKDNPKHDLFVLWTTAEQTARPMYATITAFNKSMSVSSSNIMKVRPLKDSQDPSEFLHQDMNYLLLSRNDVNALSKNGSERILVEVKINEYDE